jgi:hypothetical protein
MILQACIFEIVTTAVDQVPVPDWAFVALGQPVATRNFRYADMLYPDGKFKDHWRPGQSVPDVSRPETRLWFYFLAASYIDVGCEAIHFGQTELMNGNDRDLGHYAAVLDLIRTYAARHARRHMVLCDSHVPGGGLVRAGRLLMDFHSFPLRIMEVPERPQEAILKVGFSDGLYGRSKGGTTFSGWACEHLPYLVEIDNWGVSRQPGAAKAGGIWIWGYDEITWFAHQSRSYRSNWLHYAWAWVRQTDPNAYLQMPGSRTLASPRDGLRWYYANRPSPAVPEGFDDEAAIRAVWAAPAAHRPGGREPGERSGRAAPVHLVDGRLVGGFDDQFVDADVRRSGGHPHERFGHVLRRQRRHAFVDLPGARGVAPEADERELGFRQARIDRANPHAGARELESEGPRNLEFPGLGGAVGGAALVGSVARH